MGISVSRTEHTVARHAGRTTLEQSFRFDGAGATAAAVRDVLLQDPLIGSNSIFGDRPGEEAAPTEGSRCLLGFSPAPGFHFDVELSERSQGTFLVRFSQPDRRVPYLAGDLLWTVHDEGSSAVLHEQINTAAMLEEGLQPLEGPRPSLRRWLFFRAGHQQVMRGATRNIGRLLDKRQI